MNYYSVLHVCPTCFARFRSHGDLRYHERLSHRRQLMRQGWLVRTRHLVGL